MTTTYVARLAGVAGRVLRSMRTLPGIAGAVLVVVGVNLALGAWAAFISAGVFLLMIDRGL